MSKELDKELYPDYEYPEYTPNPEEPFREPIAKLGKLITDRVPQKLGLKKITREDPEYWGLAAVLSDEEAELPSSWGFVSRKPCRKSSNSAIWSRRSAKRCWRGWPAKDFWSTTMRTRPG